jgi:hypothetical protein
MSQGSCTSWPHTLAQLLADTRLWGLAVAGSDAAGRKTPHNHAQTARNLRRSLRNAAAGARLIQTKGWTADRLPMLQHPSQMPSKSFTGSSRTSIDVSDPTRYGWFGLQLGHLPSVPVQSSLPVCQWTHRMPRRHWQRYGGRGM